MKRSYFYGLVLLTIILLMSACVPFTFSPPTEIHLDPGDQMEDAVIAVDGNGRSHIAGVVNDRIVYYRTHYGEPLAKFAMVMTGSGTDWKQFDPDIAAMNDGTAYIVWVEQHGGPEKYACWRYVPLYPPVGGYQKNCLPLDTTLQTTGNVRVVSNGYFVYAVYDRLYLTDSMGRIGALMYKELPNIANTGAAYDYINYFQTGDIYGLDMVIDTAGKLHIAIMDNYTVTGSPPYTDRLHYRSNVTTDSLGTMEQGLTIASGASLGEDVNPSISIYTDSVTGPRIGIASIWRPTGKDYIYVDSCTVIGCNYVGTHLVDLPSSWDTYSIIEDLEIQGRGEELFLSFIGDNSTSSPPQVYYTEAFDTTIFMEPSDGSNTYKYGLELVLVEPRPESPATELVPVLSWGETTFVSNQFYAAGWLTEVVLITRDNCVGTPSGNMDSNGINLSGVWDSCSNTWFTTQAWMSHLPLIVK